MTITGSSVVERPASSSAEPVSASSKSSPPPSTRSERPLLAEQLDSRGVQRQRLDVDLDAHLGALGDVAEVLKQAVGDVDRAGDAGVNGGTAQRDAGHRASVSGQQRRRGGLRLAARLDQREPAGGRARGAGDGDRIADARGVAAQDGRAAVLQRRAAEYRDRERGLLAAHDVAAGHPHIVAAAGFGHAVDEGVEIIEGERGREHGGDERVTRPRAHGGDVGDVGGDGAPADVGHGHGVAPPVVARDQRVGGCDDGSATLDGPDGGVVARGDEDLERRRVAESRDDAVDECEFAEFGVGHSVSVRRARARRLSSPPYSRPGSRSGRWRRFR